MIDLYELQQEHREIADLIGKSLSGENPVIPYFIHKGPFFNRDSCMKARKGIYVFKVTKEIKLTKAMINRYNSARNWNSSLVGAGFNAPYPDRLNPGDVFYLGKVSSKTRSIYQRLKTHFGDCTDSATNGIKMKMPEREFVDGNLEVHTFFFDKQYEEVMQIIIDPVEKILHEKLRPITGGRQ